MLGSIAEINYDINKRPSLVSIFFDFEINLEPFTVYVKIAPLVATPIIVVYNPLPTLY